MDWQPLSNLDPLHGELQHYEFLFPGEDKPRQPADWKYVMTEIAGWLWDKGYLKPEDCPIRRSRARIRYLVHTEPRHSDGSTFSDWVVDGGLYLYVGEEEYEARPGVYVETKDNNDRLVDNARVIIERVAPQLAAEFRFSADSIDCHKQYPFWHTSI